MTVPAALSQMDAASASGIGDRFFPARVIEIEITEPLPSLSYDRQYLGVWVLGRLHAEPVGVCRIRFGPEGLTPDRLAALLWPELRETVVARFAAAGRPEPQGLTGQGLQAGTVPWPLLRERSEALAEAPFISVVICTRGRPRHLEKCLRQVGRMAYPRFEVVVVDNAPADQAVRDLVHGRQSEVAYHYVVEPRGGLSWARNAGLAAAHGEIVAFLDDDVDPDNQWLTSLACGFARGDGIGCVTGLILPAQLDTEAQDIFEQLGGHSKGRGFSRAVFSRHGPQSPIYPLPAFGAGANMAFRREVLERIGGFDVALGAGTPAYAGEDTLALTLTLLAGYHIAYEPTALVWHAHRQDVKGLSNQLYGYGVGLTAYYVALLRHQPGVITALLKLIPHMPGYLRKAGSSPTKAQPAVLTGLMRRKRRGMLVGPAAYARSAYMQAQVAGSSPTLPEARR